VIDFASSSPDDTLAVGRRLSRVLRGDDIVLLSGRLGSGKTLLVSGIAEGLGVEEQVTSPSFVLVHEYHGFLNVVHADLYRLSSMNEFEDLDLPAMAKSGVLVIEWGGVVAGSMSDYLFIEIDIVDENSRKLRFRPVGSWENRSLEEIVG